MNPTLPDNNPGDNQQIIDQIDNFIKGLDTPPGTTVATSVVTRTSVEPKEEEVKVPKRDDEMKEFVKAFS